MSADAVARAFRAISDEATLGGLRERLLAAAVELAGAERGLLILQVEGELVVIAEARGTAVNLVDPPRPLDATLSSALTRAEPTAGECCLPLAGHGFLVLSRPAGFPAEQLALLEPLAAYGAASLDRAHGQAALERENQELRRSEDLYRRAIVQAGGVPYVLDYATSSYTFIGGAIEELTGYSRAEFTPEFWESMVEEAELQGQQAGLSDEEAVRRTRSGEFRQWRCDQLIRTRSGERRWLADASVEIIGKDGHSIGSIGLLQDITERKRTEEQLSRLAAVMEATSDVVGMADPDGRALYINRAGRRLLGIGEDEDISTLTISDFHPAWAAARVLDEGLATAARVGTWTGESAMLDRDGHEIPVSQVLIAHKDDRSENVRFFSTIARDMRERRELEEQLRQAQKMEAIGRLAGGIAHDFNNLLTAIGGYSMLLLDRIEPASPLRRDVEEVSKAGELAAGLTQQLLVFSRRQVLQPQVLDLNSVVADIETLLRRLIREDISIVTRLARRPIPVLADPGQLSQVVVNLAVNAEDAMPHGGSLTIQSAAIDLETSEMLGHTAAEPGAYALLSVSDTGVGMDEETRRQIFEPFFTTKERGKGGTGLGLATVFGIVEQSGGHIAVVSEPGQGSTFTIYLPRAEGAPIAARSATDAADGDAGHGSVLLVEDDEAVRKLAHDVLHMHGYTVIEASAGDEALRLTEGWAGPLDLLVTDVVMPGMSGRELADRLVKRWPDLRVLFMSGYADEAFFRYGALRSGQAFLQKPFTPGILARKARDVLAG